MHKLGILSPHQFAQLNYDTTFQIYAYNAIDAT